MNKKIAIVVQRVHSSVVGGSERLAHEYARLLGKTHQVTVLSTCATDYRSWKNELPPGEELVDGYIIRRFPVDIPRTPYWHQLHRRLLQAYQYTSHTIKDWRPALQEEFIRAQGPYSLELLSYLRHYSADFHSILFVTYLYPTTYFGIEAAQSKNVLLAPTLHDEPPAWLPVFRRRAHEIDGLIWLTDAERRLSERMWGPRPGQVVGMPIASSLAPGAKEKARDYILYSGRIDPAKGCDILLQYFLRYIAENKRDLRLVLTGQCAMDLPNHKSVEFRGYVSHEEKRTLMRDAIAFVMPSSNESFSIVTLEAMSQGTPVIVNQNSDVLTEHIQRSGAGYAFSTYGSFCSALDRLVSIPGQDACGQRVKGRKYVVDNYSAERVRAQLSRALAGAWEST